MRSSSDLLFQIRSDPRFSILESTVQMLDNQVVNNNFYSVFLRKLRASRYT